MLIDLFLVGGGVVILLVGSVVRTVCLHTQRATDALYNTGIMNTISTHTRNRVAEMKYKAMRKYPVLQPAALKDGDSK